MQPRTAVHEFAQVVEPGRRLAGYGGRVGARLAGYGAREVTRLAYWLAVVIPLAYLLVLPASAFALVDIQTVVWMALVHALAVVLGHHHDPR